MMSDGDERQAERGVHASETALPAIRRIENRDLAMCWYVGAYSQLRLTGEQSLLAQPCWEVFAGVNAQASHACFQRGPRRPYAGRPARLGSARQWTAFRRMRQPLDHWVIFLWPRRFPNEGSEYGRPTLPSNERLRVRLRSRARHPPGQLDDVRCGRHRSDLSWRRDPGTRARISADGASVG